MYFIIDKALAGLTEERFGTSQLQNWVTSISASLLSPPVARTCLKDASALLNEGIDTVQLGDTLGLCI